jgi:hypothetical protein
MFQLQLKTKSVPRSKHSALAIQTSQLLLYREITAVCSEINTIINTLISLCGQNVEMLYVIPGGTYSDHCCHIIIQESLDLSSYSFVL